MESIVKRYFRIVNLLLLAGIAFLAALVFNNLLAEKIVGLETTTAQKKTKKKASKQQNLAAGEWAEIIVQRNLFNSEPPDAGPPESDGGETDAGPAMDPTKIPTNLEDCAKSDAPVRLSATMLAEPEEWSLAAVEEEGKDRLVRAGVMVGDHELVAIRRGWIVLAEGTKFECVEIGGAKKRRPNRYGSSSSSSNSSRSKSSSKSKKNKYKEGIKKTGKNAYDIDKNSLNEWLDDIGTLSRQARVIPHYRGGKPQGFKIVGVRPGSLYTNLGIRSGDILKSVNGEEVTSPTKALELYEKLKTSDSVTLDIERRGRKATYEYNIK